MHQTDKPMILTFHKPPSWSRHGRCIRASRFTTGPPGLGTDDMSVHHVSRLAPLVLSLLLLGCGGGVKLTNLPDTRAALNLSEAQQESIEPQIALIRDIIEDYEFERDEVEAEYRSYYTRANLPRMSRYESGRLDRGTRLEWHEFRMKLRSFVAQRRQYAKEISGLINDIKANLTPGQQDAFEDIELPELELPEVLRRRTHDDFGMRLRGVPFDF